MSVLRPETSNNESGKPVLSGGTAYYAIYNAVNEQKGLVHGRLHARGAHCAIGSLWHANPNVALPTYLIDEVAAVNDSMPNATPRQRKTRMQRWLRWRLGTLGMRLPGIRAR